MALFAPAAGAPAAGDDAVPAGTAGAWPMVTVMSTDSSTPSDSSCCSSLLSGLVCKRLRRTHCSKLNEGCALSAACVRAVTGCATVLLCIDCGANCCACLQAKERTKQRDDHRPVVRAPSRPAALLKPADGVCCCSASSASTVDRPCQALRRSRTCPLSAWPMVGQSPHTSRPLPSS